MHPSTAAGVTLTVFDREGTRIGGAVRDPDGTVRDVQGLEGPGAALVAAFVAGTRAGPRPSC